MKKGIRSIAVLTALSTLFSVPAFAATRITYVTNDFTTANDVCSVRTVNGYGGYGFSVLIFGVDCPNDPEVYPEKVEYFNDAGYLGCEMRMYSSTHYVSGICGNYRIWRN